MDPLHQVDCFNTTTLAPTDDDKVELYNVGTDPFETTDLAASHPKVVQELMARLSVYAQSADQVPPTIFWPFDQNETGANGQRSIAPWNYQCPQCCHSGALPGPRGHHFDPWCDNVTCGVGPPCVPAPTPTPAPAPAPTTKCPLPWRMQMGGMGGGSNEDIHVEKAAGHGP